MDIIEAIEGRHCVRAFLDKPVEPETITRILTAARWAPSCYNEQPWRFIVATRSDPPDFERLLSCLVETNQVWARLAPVLALGIAHRTFARNDKPNRHATHDLGQAVANLSLEATARGLAVHQMGGILPERARELYAIPDDAEALTALAIGYLGAPEDLSGDLAERDRAPRTRKPLREFVFGRRWGQASSVV